MGVFCWRGRSKGENISRGNGNNKGSIIYRQITRNQGGWSYGYNKGSLGPCHSSPVTPHPSFPLCLPCQTSRDVVRSPPEYPSLFWTKRTTLLVDHGHLVNLPPSPRSSFRCIRGHNRCVHSVLPPNLVPVSLSVLRRPYIRPLSYWTWSTTNLFLRLPLPPIVL